MNVYDPHSFLQKLSSSKKAFLPPASEKQKKKTGRITQI